jgi:DNA-binding CsgD family transcriptional regulator
MIVPTLSSRRLVGRGAELQLLHDARRALANGRGSVVLVGGEAGIGKTRLLSEFAATLTGGRAPHYALGECLQDAPRPFGPFRTLLSSLIELAPGSLDAPSPLTRRTLAALVPDALEARGISVPAPVAVEKAELFTGVLRYLEAVAAKRATILALEDLHWADSGTLDLLAHIAPRIAGTRLMIVATYRDDEIHGEHPLLATLARLERQQTVRRIGLEPLGDSDLRALIGEALGRKYVLEPDQIRDVVARSEGNPFFAEEILKKALERNGPGSAALPISIRAMILERIGGLEGTDRDVLDHAAVLGPQFDAETLATVMARDRRHVLRSLRRLRDLNLILEGTSPRSQFRFRHDLTRQTAYDELLTVDTRALHAQIAAALERLPDVGARIDDLAYHAWKAGMRDATLRYSERAGDAALALRAAVQAAAYYERTLEIVADDDAKVRLLGKVGEAYLQQSDFARATTSYMAQHSMLLARREYDAAALALTRAAAEFANGGQVQKGLALLESFEQEHGSRLTEAALDHLRSSLARIATACDDFARARSALAKVREPERLATFTHQVYWLARLFCSEHDVDVGAWNAAVAALRARNPETYPLMRSQMLHSIASTGVVFAEHAEAERAVDEALAIDRELGFSRALAYASAVKACLLCVQGRLVEARACIEAALLEPDMFVIRLELALGASPAALALGDDDLAVRCLDDDVFRSVREAGMEGAYSAMAGMRAARLFALGRIEEGRRMLDAAIDGVQHQFAAVYLWPFAARHIDGTRLGRLRSLCAAHASNADYRVIHACSALLEAVAARRTGSENAGELAESAVERYRALGWPLQEAQALEVAGRSDAALSLYRSCGSIVDVRRLETGAPATRKRDVGSGRLSPREREVAALVARGLSNRAIAGELCVGEKTIEKYVSAIYAKLGFSTRTQLAAHVARSEASA